MPSRLSWRGRSSATRGSLQQIYVETSLGYRPTEPAGLGCEEGGAEGVGARCSSETAIESIARDSIHGEARTFMCDCECSKEGVAISLLSQEEGRRAKQVYAREAPATSRAPFERRPPAPPLGRGLYTGNPTPHCTISSIVVK